MLLPKSLASEATAKNLNELKLQKRTRDKVAAEQLAGHRLSVKRSREKQVTVAIKVGEGRKSIRKCIGKENCRSSQRTAWIRH